MTRLVAKSFTLAVALLGASSLAHSADPVEPVVEAYHGPSWTGFYLGGHLGAAMGDLGYTQLGIPEFDRTDTNYALGSFELAYGIHGGFDYQFARRWVGGIELGYTHLGSKYVPFISGNDNVLAEAKSMYYGSARLGYLTTPETLFYGRVGYAGIDFEAEGSFFDTANKTVGALQLGVGAETFIARNLTARVEANYYNAGSDFVLADDFESFDPKFLVVTAGLTYRFGADRGSSHETAAPVERNWTGFYAGLQGSYNFANMEQEVDMAMTTVGPFAANGFGAGGFAGFDFQFADRYVLGVEAEATYLDGLKFHDPAGNTLDPEGTTKFGTIDAMYGISARLGYVTSPSTLVYLKGGWAALQTEANKDFYALDGGGSKTIGAYQIGAGIESALSEKLTLRVEGTYVEALDGLTTDNSQLGQITLTPSLLIGKVGVAYRF